MRYLISFIMVVWVMASAAHAETITMAADSWCPYNCEPESANPGYIVEVARKAFAKHDIKVEYQILPWPRAIKETSEGKHNAIIGASRNDAPDFIFPSIEQAFMRNAFYVKKGSNWRYSGIKSLDSVSLGLIRDYAYGTTLDEYIKANQNNMKRIQLASGDNALDANIKKLLAGRVGAIVEAEAVMTYKMHEQPGLKETLDFAGSVEASIEDNLYIAFSPVIKDSQRYADILSQEMIKMRESGELTAILKSYGLQDWKN